MTAVYAETKVYHALTKKYTTKSKIQFFGIFTAPLLNILTKCVNIYTVSI